MTVAITTVTCLTDVDGGTGLVGAVGALGAPAAGCRLIDAVEVQILLKQTKQNLTYIQVQVHTKHTRYTQ